MLKVWSNSNYLRVGVNIRFVDTNQHPCSHLARYDPLLRCFTDTSRELVVPMDPVSESGLFGGSFFNDGSVTVFKRKPTTSKVRDMSVYDQHHYGTFVDSVQGFMSVLAGKLEAPPLKKVFSQHFTKHKNFQGQATTGTLDLSTGLSHLSDFENFFDEELITRHYPESKYRVILDPSGIVDYATTGALGDVYDVSPLFDLLSKRSLTAIYVLDGATFTTTISNFAYSCVDRLQFEYTAHMVEDDPSGIYTFDYHFYYRSGGLTIISDESGPPHIVGLGNEPSVYGVTYCTSNLPHVNGPFEASTVDTYPGFNGRTYGRIMAVPSPIDHVDSDGESLVSRRLHSIGQPFWLSVEDNLFDITALSRDTATVALTRLSEQAFEPDVKRLKAINPLKVSSDSLLAHTANAALGDFLRKSLKDILRPVGGAPAVRYRTIISDCIQILQSLEVLDSLRNEPSRLYSAVSQYEYPVELGGRECIIRVRSKVYLELSPFRLLQILIGRQAVIILNDLLALYYTSIPLGEILLTLLQLRKVSDLMTSRMFFDLPMFFVHSYLVESPLTQEELDYTGISNLAGRPVKVTYYIRDISQYLPVIRFSNLATFYGTGDVGNVVWSLLQLLVGVLS